ncbi:hypothetical protein EV174_005064 [Coemansia sp. RSA 2320]|nr:hypothetical protein EV174_005064 [Coemansia sp. RSA 2320]
MVLAEASATGTSSMMRRSAVMAVAKMTAREEYRSAAAAAAIAASVAAAATAPPSGKSATAAGGGNSRRSAKKPNATPRKAEVLAGGSMAQKQLSRRGRRNRRLSRGGADGDGAGESEGDYDVDDSDTKMHNTANNGLSSGSQNRGDGDDSQVERSKGTARRSSTAANSPLSARKAQPSKRVAARQTNGVSKRRKVGYQSPSESPDGVGTEQTSAERAHMGDIDCEDGGFAEDLVARVMGAKPGTPKSKSKVRTPRSRNRSISSAVKPSAGFDAEEDLANADYAAALTGLPRRRGSKSELHDRAGGRRRGKSEPGSPVQLSESPMLPLLLYAGGDCGGESSAGADGQSDIEESGRHTGHLSKRKRTGGTSRSSKHLRMTVSAANSPSLGDAAGFAAFTDAISRNRAATGLAGSEGENNGQSGDDCNAFSGGDGRGDDCDADEQASVQRQPKHNYPPLETVDVDGNRIVVPSNMLNTQGQPIYSSVASDTMCKIRYPHSRANLYELNRRAKQLLEWLGKAQSEYEQERVTWLPPLGSNNEETEAMPTLQSLSLDDIAVGNRAALTRGISHQISDAPTSPIHPSDWPADDNFDGESTTATTDVVPAAVAMVEADERQPRSTLSMMEDLMWRLIRFQETYSN